jgi:hypothetical protein
MAIWGQTVIWNGPAAALDDWGPVRILFHSLDPGYYAVFARMMFAPYGGTAMYEHAAYAQLTLGSATDETYARLRCELPNSSDDAIKASTPVTLETVGRSSDDGRGGIDLIVRGRGALVVETRINIISLDEMRDPSDHEGSYPLDHEDAPALHVPDYSRDIFVPVSKARTSVEGGGASG